jgi:hypothetical protein
LFISPAKELETMNEYVEAQWTIPYCQYREMADGFKLRLKTVARQDLTHAWRSVAGALLVVVWPMVSFLTFGGFVGTLLSLAGFYAAYRILWIDTTLEVTKDAIIVDGKHYRRADFGSFNMSGKAGGKNLAFSYGAISIDFAGAWWSSAKAAEFANALNIRIRQAPVTEAGNQPSPDQLRTATRPQEF